MRKVPRLLSRLAGVAACAALAVLGATTPAAAQECASSADAAGCPFRCLGSTNPVGATPTPAGNSICAAVDNLAAIAQQVGDQATAFVQPAVDDMNAFAMVALSGAINTNAIQTYNSALQRADVIEGRITEFLGDPVCGSEAALDQLRQFFTDQASNLIAAGQIAGSTAEALAALQPAISEVDNIISQLQTIHQNVMESGPEAQKQYQILMSAMEKLKTQLQELAALDVPGTVIAGAELAGSVGPFMTNCAGCTAALVGAVSSLVTGSATATGSGAVCPETVEFAGGSCWGILGFPVGLSVSTIAGALATPPCASAAEGLGKMAEYLEKIGTFVTTSAALAQGIAESIGTMMTASEALANLAAELGAESEPQLQSIAASLNVTADAINASSAIMATEVAPKVATLAGDVVQQIGSNVVTMATCYNKLHDVAAAVGGDVLNGVNELVLATAHLVDGGQVVSNLATQSENARLAASTYATNQFQSLRAERNRIHNELWGVSWPTVPSPTPSTFAHIAGFLNPVRSPSLLTLGNDIVALESATAAVVPSAVLEGKKAFLDLSADQNGARQSFDLAGGLAQNALTKMDNPGTPAVGAMNVPGAHSVATLPAKFIGVNVRAPRTSIRVRASVDLLASHLREVRELDVIQRSPDGKPIAGGTACRSCPRDYGMKPIWESMDRARVTEAVSIRLYDGTKLVADLGTHAPPRGGSWTGMPAYVGVSPRGSFSDEATGCGYRVVVTGARGQTLAETGTCMKRN